ncbi:MAG: hypothetical protein HUU26_01030 [Gemmatimonadaceae bacterium]|nr:hypothetical protein [Planctomycetota bacterium]NUQ10898.1 hypothetical protein [Gemmatimonadaceae bacterium]
MRIELKWVEYRGGIVRFRIPKAWKEEYAPEGGGVFYGERPGSGTLRLDLVSAHGAGHRTTKDLVAHFERKGPFESLQDDLRIRRSRHPIVEAGVSGFLHRWEVAVPVPPDRIRIACFTYAVAARDEDDATNRSEIALVDWSVRRAEYSRDPGRTDPRGTG